MIKGNEIFLDALSRSDEIRLIRNQPVIKDWCRQHTLISDASQESWYQRIESDPTIKMFSIFSSADKSYEASAMVGVCGLTDINLIHRRAEFSLYIFPHHWRKGYAFDALQTLFRHAFDDWNLNSIWGETFDGNPALSLFTDKLGMVYEGTRRQFYFKKGNYIDAHIVSITKKEFYDRTGYQ
jgi:RimJ/RimL family protein N-acetyltransferase